MGKLSKRIDPAESNNTEYAQEHIRIIILGLLTATSKSPSGTIFVDTIEAQLRKCGILGIDTRRELDSIIKSYRWLGLTWTDPERTALSTLGGVRWFSNSSMYSKLADCVPKYDLLTQLFSKEISKLSMRITNPNFLVDAGSTTYHSLFHRDCSRLRTRIDRLLTNNLFVALRWQEEFQDKGNITLIGGVPNLDTAATVDHEKLDQWLNASTRIPDVALLSWHYIVPVDKEGKSDVLLLTKDKRELEVKRSAMNATKSVVYVVFSKDKIVNNYPSDAKQYSLAKDVIAQQQSYFSRKGARRDITGYRDIYLITDIDEPNELQMMVIKILSEKRFKENHIHLIHLKSGEP